MPLSREYDILPKISYNGYTITLQMVIDAYLCMLLIQIKLSQIKVIYVKNEALFCTNLCISKGYDKDRDRLFQELLSGWAVERTLQCARAVRTANSGCRSGYRHDGA